MGTRKLALSHHCCLLGVLQLQVGLRSWGQELNPDTLLECIGIWMVSLKAHFEGVNSNLFEVQETKMTVRRHRPNIKLFTTIN